ncbi:hypothetical protein LZG04_29630 [Saccharothrix sp. S26]|uniref:hypothetical protein n=1 Tax=Saccharothrix sp. S26 TaxID=2907215 RepID=UPI001F3F37C3|nr:hypothetical protein [Saccharothrix sp. S26]MCE6998930.1 hypothetical protein [Saccharothrix sp. S26]
MTPLAKWTIVSVSLTVLAVLVPWATYGDHDIELSRLPLWWTYLGAAAVMHACARVAPPVSAGFVVVAVASAVLVATGYDEASRIFGHVVPLVVPRPGLGVVFAVASAAAQAAGLRGRARAARPLPA